MSNKLLAWLGTMWKKHTAARLERDHQARLEWERQNPGPWHTVTDWPKRAPND